MARIPMLEPDQIDPRLKGPDGSVSSSTFFRVMAHAPNAMLGCRGMGDAMFSKLSINEIDREMMVLLVTDLQKGAYQFAQHVTIGKKVGVAEEQIDAIKRRAFGDAGILPRQAALLAFAKEVAENVRCSDAAFEAVHKHYNYEQIVESMYCIGWYMLLARISEVAQVPVDNEGIKSWQASQDAKARAAAAAS